MTRIAVVGHVEWVEFVSVGRFPAPGDVIHAGGSFKRAAGGGGVVAAVLVELGAEVDFFCALGRDADGAAAAAQLADRGIRAHIAWRQAPTRRAVTLLAPDGERTIVTLGERLEAWGSDELEWERLDHADGAYVTAGDAGALHRARRARVVVASPRARGALNTTGAMIDALVFSAHDRDEAQWAKLLTDHARLLVATEGRVGGHWSRSNGPLAPGSRSGSAEAESEGRWSAVDPSGEPRDAYGCGDSFAAGFTFGLATGSSVAEAAALGARCGARCLTRAGAP